MTYLSEEQLKTMRTPAPSQGYTVLFGRLLQAAGNLHPVTAAFVGILWERWQQKQHWDNASPQWVEKREKFISFVQNNWEHPKGQNHANNLGD